MVEAALRSGARNTASWALECGRPLMAVPGSIHSRLDRPAPDDQERPGGAGHQRGRGMELISEAGEATLPLSHGPQTDDRRAEPSSSWRSTRRYRLGAARRSATSPWPPEVSVPSCLAALSTLAGRVWSREMPVAGWPRSAGPVDDRHLLSQSISQSFHLSGFSYVTSRWCVAFLPPWCFPCYSEREPSLPIRPPTVGPSRRALTRPPRHEPASGGSRLDLGRGWVRSGLLRLAGHGGPAGLVGDPSRGQPTSRRPVPARWTRPVPTVGRAPTSSVDPGKGVYRLAGPDSDYACVRRSGCPAQPGSAHHVLGVPRAPGSLHVD